MGDSLSLGVLYRRGTTALALLFHVWVSSDAD